MHAGERGGVGGRGGAGRGSGAEGWRIESRGGVNPLGVESLWIHAELAM